MPESRAEALVEIGLGAVRALVMDGDTVREAHLERDDAGLQPGTVVEARLTSILVPGKRGIVRIGTHEALLEPLPRPAEGALRHMTEGALLRAEVVRAAIPEAGRPRLAKVRATEAPLAEGADLVTRLRAAGHGITLLGGSRLSGSGPDRLEAAGWSEMVEAAMTGHVAFAGGMLTISPTPAMTVIDVDGPGDSEALAQAAATAVASALRLLGITGSVAVDFPSIAGKAARAALDAQLAAALTVQLEGPFEKTAINGFGLVQIVRPRAFPSLLEQVRAPGFAALELLRRAARHIGGGTLTAHPQVTGWLERRPDLIAALARQIGGPVSLATDAGLAMMAGHVA
ncbi:ribonuclease E/G [Sandarakinorhabdus sp.]|uniref:ribonuclease E/G n=1 Tax=Sandarakinorhabdus sp. TaxID=1916663 RepID=UPI00286D7B8F|nr:ribonuclease E/G [Sandarakinorhabdus sp.]